MSDKFPPDLKLIRTGVKALILHQNKVLLVKEVIDGEIVYDFPGGGLEYGESLIQALKREVKEEIGLEVKVKGVVGAWSFIVKGSQTQAVLIGYQCSLKDTDNLTIDLSHNPAKNEHIVDTLWVDLDELITQGEKKYHLPSGMIKAVSQL